MKDMTPPMKGPMSAQNEQKNKQTNKQNPDHIQTLDGNISEKLNQ